jgi:hypothetical protein
VFARLLASWARRGWARYSALTGAAFVVRFVVTSAGFAQVAGLAGAAGLFQHVTLTVGWGWMTALAVWLLIAPEAAHTD